jgi:hypothetical protein
MFVAVSLLSVLPMSVSAAAPHNDNATDAKIIRDLDFSATANNQDATTEPGETLDRCNYQTENRTRWYRYTPVWGTTVHVTVQSDFDAILTIWLGDSPDSLQFFDCSDQGGADTVERVGIDIEQGVRYWFRVAGKENAFGSYTLNVISGQPAPPANDNFVDARLIAGQPFSTHGNTQYARPEAGEPPMCTPTEHIVWFRYESHRRRLLMASTWGSSFDTVLGVFRGTSLADLTAVACNDDTGGLQHSKVIFRARPGVTYWFAIGGKTGDFGPYRLRLRTP